MAAWKDVERLYHAALERPAAERPAFLVDACGADEAVRREVESLLAHAASTAGVLDGGAVGAAAQLVSAPDHSMLTGRRLGVYQITAPIGKGGMGEVYCARDTRLGRDVAIKILPRAFITDADRLARFEREARVLASLNHPNIATIYGIEDVDGIRALAMELIEGETLAERIAKGSIQIAVALPLARQIAEALDTAHEKGIVHRDLKPANIKITRDGVVKVLDFGLAKASGAAAADDAPTMTIDGTREGAIVGTAAYMSPEQARGLPLDKRTDIWAFGCVLYEMLTGRAAFAGNTVSDIIAAILEREPDWTALPATTPPNIRILLGRCLEKDSKRRIRDVADARFELEHPDAHTGTTPAGSGRARERLAWTFAAILLIAASIFGVAAFRQSRAPSAPTPPRIIKTTRVTNTPEQEFGAALAPDGKWMAYYSNAGGRPNLWVKILDSGATLNLTGNLNLDLPGRAALGGLDISPDGSAIAFSARQRVEGNPALDTWVIPAPVGGVPRKVASGLQSPRWSPDGTQMAVMGAGASAGDTLWIVNADGSNLREIIKRGGGRHVHCPVWSRDGRFIYFIHSIFVWHDDWSEIWRVAVGGGEPEALVRSNRRAIYPAPLPDGSLIFAANPSSIDLAIWWRAADGGAPVPLTNGVGEHSELRVSADGRHIVATLQEMRQSLVSIPVRFGRPATEVQLTTGYTGDMHPAIDPHSNRLVFSSSRTGNRNLWRGNGDASGATPLTSETAIDKRPSFSPDGQQIAFASDRNGELGIWLMSVEGGAPRLIAKTVALDTIAWSPDATRLLIAQATPGLPRLASVSLVDGSISPFPTEGAASAPAWSPITNRIAYLEPSLPTTATEPSRTYVAIVDAAGRRLFPDLPKTVAFQNGSLAWAPDGRRLAALAIQSNIPASIWIVEPESKTPFRQLVELPLSVRPTGITWSTDGQSVIVAKQDSSSDIVLFDLTR